MFILYTLPGKRLLTTLAPGCPVYPNKSSSALIREGKFRPGPKLRLEKYEKVLLLFNSLLLFLLLLLYPFLVVLLLLV